MNVKDNPFTGVIAVVVLDKIPVQTNKNEQNTVFMLM